MAGVGSYSGEREPVKMREVPNFKGIESSVTRGLTYCVNEKTLYASHSVLLNDGREQWWIRRSFDFGATWQTDYTLDVRTTFQGSGGRDIAFTKAGSLFAIGRTEDDQSRSHWLVLRRKAEEWKLVDDFTFYPAPSESYAYHLAASPSGEICVAGKVSRKDSTIGGEDRWVIRCSSDDGETWKNLDEEVDSHATSLAFDSRENLYAAGLHFAEGGASGILRAKKREHASTRWSVVDDFKYAGRFTARISAFVDSRDHVYIVGSGWENASDGSQLRRWIVRCSRDRGKTWATVDRFTLHETTFSEAYQLAESKRGDLFAVGYAKDPENRFHTIVRASSDEGRTWRTVIDSLGAFEQGFYGHNIAATEDRIFFSGAPYQGAMRFSTISEVALTQ
jgi:hypothetical protein